MYHEHFGPCVPNKKGSPKGELTLRTSVITHGSKGELALRGTFLFGAHGPKYGLNSMWVRDRSHIRKPPRGGVRKAYSCLRGRGV